MRERDLESLCKRLVEKQGGLLLKFVSPGTAGVPDRVLLLPGRVPVFVEFKRAGGRVTPLQAAMMRRIQAAGGLVYVVSSTTEFLGVLEAVPAGGGTASIES